MFSEMFTPDSIGADVEFDKEDTPSTYEEITTSQQTQDTEVVWGSMPVYEGNIRHYAEI